MANDCEVLVIGSGPAGSATACVLARAGIETVLVDRQVFPRDKVCGDALIPDAISALRSLDLWDHVRPLGYETQRVRLYAPDQTSVEISGHCACVPRQLLDEQLRLAAVDSGTTFLPGLAATAPVTVGSMIGGATFVANPGGELRTIRAPTTVLATGADSGLLSKFGVCLRSMPSATAARAYFRLQSETETDLNSLILSFDRAIRPGYGWVFPGPAQTFNVGVGYFYDGRHRPSERNLNRLFKNFIETFPPAARIAAGGSQVTRLKGAPLRTAFSGSIAALPGLLVVGEAAGLTYSFSGEGIGKALQSGILAAEEILKVRSASQGGVAALADNYARRLENDFRDRFEAYRSAQTWLSYPWLVNLLARRANSGKFVRRQLEALFNETATPRELFSLSGFARALFT